MGSKLVKDCPSDCTCETCCPCEPVCRSNCDGDTTNNYWVEGQVCLLDTLRVDQIEYIIERNPFARKDLARVTKNPALLALLDRTKMLPPADNPTKTSVSVNADAYYTIFQGKPPYRQK